MGHGHGPAEEAALHHVAPELPQTGQLGSAFHALGHHTQGSVPRGLPARRLGRLGMMREIAPFSPSHAHAAHFGASIGAPTA
jgi:hypothetical protein